MKPLERALVKGERCVRVPLTLTNHVCTECPHVVFIGDGGCNADNTCGKGHVWVREITYITELLEGNAAGR